MNKTSSDQSDFLIYEGDYSILYLQDCFSNFIVKCELPKQFYVLSGSLPEWIMAMLQTKLTGQITEILAISNGGPLATINYSGNWLEKSRFEDGPGEVRVERRFILSN